jgi:hypothetical protein
MRHVVPFLPIALLACSTPERTPTPASASAPATPNPPDDPRVCTAVATSEAATRVLLLVDRSGSMGESMNAINGAALDRWSVLRSALVDVTAALSDVVPHGLVLFPSRDGEICDAGGEVVAMGVDNAPTIASALSLAIPSGGTPTAPSLGVARELVEGLLDDGAPPVIVLATDGAPNCNEANVNPTCACTDPDAAPGQCAPINCVDDVGTFAELTTLRALGVKTFVIGVGVDAFAAPTIEQMAIFGGTARFIEADDDADGTDGTLWFDARDELTLRTSLEDVMQRALACRVATDANVDLNALESDDIEVRAGDVVVPHDGGRLDGWARLDATTIELYGPACDRAADAGAITVSTCG